MAMEHQLSSEDTEDESNQSEQESLLQVQSNQSEEESLLQEIGDIKFDVEGEIVHASKACLSCHSPVLRAMFFGNFKERDCSIIPLPGKSVEGMKKFVHVTHLAEEVSLANVYDVLPIAHEYQCEKILAQCDKFLLSQEFSVQNLAVCSQYGLELALEKFLTKASQFEMDYLRGDIYFPKLQECTVVQLYDQIVDRKNDVIESYETTIDEQTDKIDELTKQVEDLTEKCKDLGHYKYKLEQIVTGIRTNTWKHSRSCSAQFGYRKECQCRVKNCDHSDIKGTIRSSEKPYQFQFPNHRTYFKLMPCFKYCKECICQTLWHILECLNDCDTIGMYLG